MKNRFANVFSRSGSLYVFPWALVDDRLLTVDACSAILPSDSTVESLGLEITRALELYGRAMTPAEFKSRKNPLLAAMKQRSSKTLNIGLGHVEVDWLLDEDGRFLLIPHRAIGRGSSPMLDEAVTVSTSGGPSELGTGALKALASSSASNAA